MHIEWNITERRKVGLRRIRGERDVAEAEFQFLERQGLVLIEIAHNVPFCLVGCPACGHSFIMYFRKIARDLA